MNVLLIGGSNSLLNQMIRKMNKEGHRVSVLTGSRFRMEKYEQVFERYDFTYDAANLPEVFTSVSPDVTIFMGAFDSNFHWYNSESEAVHYISGLMNLLTAFSGIRRGRLIYLSSEAVFDGTSTAPYRAEDNGTAVDYRGMAVSQGEELCESFRITRGLDIVTVRLGGYYYLPKNPGQIDTVVARMCFDALTQRRIRIHPDHTLSFLHESDAVQFVSQIASAGELMRSRYQLSSGELLTQKELAEKVAASFARAEEGVKSRQDEQEIMLVEEDAGRGGCALDNSAFRDELGINRVRDTDAAIDDIAAYMVQHEKVFCQDLDEALPWYKRFRKSMGGLFSALLPFIENLICFIPFFMLNNRAAGSEYFAGVDLFLIYVLLFAIIHGQQQATLSAILATGGYLFRQMYSRSGYEVMVDYNTYIWIAQLFIVGMIVGYMKDQLQQLRSESKEEHSYLAEQIDDIKEINSSNVRVKDAMQSQIINQSDSIGKIYEITSTLNQYSFEEVIFYATEILGRVMDSPDVAIYTVDNSAYARLFSATSEIARSLGNSVKYVELTPMYDDLARHRVFINKSLDAGLPMMASGIYDGDDIAMILMVWRLPWEKMTLGQANLLAVTGALIQNASLRANRYLEALRSERFVGNTPILNTKEFGDLVQAYINASGRGLIVYSLIALDMYAPEEINEFHSEAVGLDDAWNAMTIPTVAPTQAESLSRQIRPHDYLGEGSDRKLYVLLTNTSAEGAEIVMDRLIRSGVSCHSVERLP